MKILGVDGCSAAFYSYACPHVMMAYAASPGIRSSTASHQQCAGGQSHTAEEDSAFCLVSACT